MNYECHDGMKCQQVDKRNCEHACSRRVRHDGTVQLVNAFTSLLKVERPAERQLRDLLQSLLDATERNQEHYSEEYEDIVRSKCLASLRSQAGSST